MIPDAYTNRTDTQSDYFDKGSVRLQEGHPLYVAARAGAVASDARRSAQRAARRERALNPQPADPRTVEIMSGKATAFLAPFSIAAVTQLTGSQRLGISPLIVMFLLSLLLLRWVNPEGEIEQ